MKYSAIELAAVIKLGKAMTLADGKVEKEEVTLQANETLSFGVDPDDLNKLFALADAMEPSTAIITVSMMDNERKKYVTGYLAAIMAADGDIDDSEVKLWRMISSLAALPTMSAQEAIEYWGNH